MTLIGRVGLGSPLVQETLEAVPDMVLQLEDVRQIPDEPRRFVVWASGDDFETFDAALTRDSTVEDFRRLTELRDRCLYRLTLSQKGQQKSVHSIIVEHDIIPLNHKIERGELQVLARFPSRNAVITLNNACQERNIPFRLEHLYSEERTANDGGMGSRFGVTDAQREALLHALEAEYFGVPRQTKLETIAEALDISTAALSTRLRRGQRNLVRHTLAQEFAI